MFSKLAFKNVGRSMKDYGVWFLTIAFGVCLFYVFNSLETQAVFQYLGSGPQAPTAQAIRELIGMLSVFVWVVLAFLILYASGFLIRHRKGELGTYLLLGMERGQVARLLLLETLCMGVLALLEPVMTLLRIPAGAWDETRAYLRVVLLGVCFTFLYNYFACLLRSVGNSVAPLAFLAVSTVLNIGLDLWFVLGLGWGVAGAAGATVLAQGVSAAGIAL